MSNEIQDSILNRPVYKELFDFLVEKTKDVAAPMNCSQLAREFKRQSGASQKVKNLLSKIFKIRSKVHQFSKIDRNTKVKLLFALSATLDYGFLKELQEHAAVTLDPSRRIIEYKEKGGGGSLQLSGKHLPAQPNEKQKKMLEFLAETAKRTNYPISVTMFLKRFQAATRSSESHLRALYHRMTNEIYECTDFDMETKIRMLFVSSAELHNYVLEELRITGQVEVDERNRITKYIANDGSLILEGDHSNSSKIKTSLAESRKSRSLLQSHDSDSDEEEIEIDEVDDEVVKDNSVTTQRGSLSKITGFFQTPNLKNRLSAKEDSDQSFCSNSSTPKLNNKRKIKDDASGTSSSKRNAAEDDDSIIDDVPPMEPIRRSKLEPFEGVLIDKTVHDDDDIQIYFPEQTNSLLVPKQEDQLINEVKFDRPHYLISVPVKNEPRPTEKDGYTSQLKILEAISTLVTSMDTPQLKDFQAKLMKKIEESGVKKSSISGVLLALESCIFMIKNNATMESSSESISLLEFLSNLNISILILKCEDFDGFREKLKSEIKTLRVNDKRVPVEKAKIALQTTLDILTT